MATILISNLSLLNQTELSAQGNIIYDLTLSEVENISGGLTNGEGIGIGVGLIGIGIAIVGGPVGILGLVVASQASYWGGVFVGTGLRNLLR